MCPSKDNNMAYPYKLLQIWVKGFSESLAYEYYYRTDLILGEAFCIFILFHFPDSGLSVLTNLYFYFDGVTIKTTE